MTNQPKPDQTPQMYDEIAWQYGASKSLSFRHHIERPTLFELLGDLRGRTMLDLACGEGVYARAFMRLGAAAVTGVDISSSMVGFAQALERSDPLGCRYVVADAANFTPDAPVDIVTAVYLWNYASTREQLDAMCRACYRALRPGGRLVGFNDNMRRPPHPDAGDALAKYGIERTCKYPPAEGDVIQYRLIVGEGEAAEFENYYLKPSTY